MLVFNDLFSSINHLTNRDRLISTYLINRYRKNRKTNPWLLCITLFLIHTCIDKSSFITRECTRRMKSKHYL